MQRLHVIVRVRGMSAYHTTRGARTCLAQKVKPCGGGGGGGGGGGLTLHLDNRDAELVQILL